MSLKLSKETVIKGVGVILRVPSLFIAEAWFRTDPKSMTHSLVSTGKGRELDPTHEVGIKTLYYAAILFAATLVVLPLRRLIILYMYLVSAALLGLAHYLSYVFVLNEKTSDYSGSPFDNTNCIRNLASHMVAQCFIGATVSYLIGLKQWTRVVLMIYIAPMIARMGNFPIMDLHRIHNFSAMCAMIFVVFYIFQNLHIVFDLIKLGIRKVSLTVQLYGWVPFLLAMWLKILLPAQFLIFWIALFVIQTVKYLSIPNHPVYSEGWIVVLLATVSECCVTPISLAGLCFTVSYLAFLILTATKIYLTGRGGFMHDNVMHQGWTEGFTMCLLSIQTRILELRTHQRAFLMSIVLFIVCSSLIQSMYEITEPFLLELSASQNKSISKHIRAIILSTFLWMFPLYMTYSICLYFDLDFWLLVVISSCVLTSVQVMGSLVVYVLFIYDAISNKPWEQLDDIVYYAKSTTRVLEFIVAVFVVAYGLKESLIGEWSWVNSSILMVHCYFNVWQRLQSGWKSYLMRREAVKKIESLPVATKEQLQNHNDLCPICYQELTSARITPCNHFFHALCLRKWLYVQESCPLCHQPIHELNDDTENEENINMGDYPADNINPEQNANEGQENINVRFFGAQPNAGSSGGTNTETDKNTVNENSMDKPTCNETHQETSQGASHARTNSEIHIRENYVFVDSKEVHGDIKDGNSQRDH